MSDPLLSHEDPESDPQLAELGHRLRAERAVPRPAFRGDLGRRLSALESHRGSGSLRAIKLRIAGLATSGGALLALAFAGVLGAGPLA